MDVGIGLPNQVPGADGRALMEFARRADARGFSTLATIGRVAYPGHDDLIALAGAAAVTERIGLMTNILLLPTHDPVLLAKQAAAIDQLSGGRLTLGVAVGGRRDDYEATQRSFEGRGRSMDAALEVLLAAWRGEPVAGATRPATPPPVRPGGIPLVFGGTSERTIERVVRYGSGWTAGGGGPEMAAPFIERVRAAWSAAGRDGSPRFVGLVYVALGDAVQDGLAYLRDYYAFIGDWAEAIASATLTTREAILSAIEAFGAVGMDELILDATVADPDQVDLLADAAFGGVG
jgi:alkanesulfonate monooxygenase SsuD/methylene tetrahydromethanopterin reductase-like flavin-dependent oxidoreductase (luciferase family)